MKIGGLDKFRDGKIMSKECKWRCRVFLFLIYLNLSHFQFVFNKTKAPQYARGGSKSGPKQCQT